MRNLQRAMVCAAVLAAAAGQAQASIITLTSDHVHVRADYAGTPNSVSGFDTDDQSNLDLDNDDHSVSASLGASSTTITNYGQPNANTVVLQGTVSHTLAAEGYSAQTSWLTKFTADQSSLTYTIDGWYESDVLSGSTPGTFLQVHLLDITLYNDFFGPYEFNNSQYSENTSSVDFLIGGSSGDTFNVLSGSQSLTGSLIQGHEYKWFVNATVSSSSVPISATASGFMRLTITSNASADVPEPTSLTLFGAGALALGFVIRRKRRPAEGA
jgi:hypothetical protein